MKNKLIILIVVIFLLFSTNVYSLTFKDVPDTHWANKAIYNLVRLGLTKGYPDGTFRGIKPISRYETAIFISDLASAVEAKLGDLKEAGEIRTEIEALKEEIEDLKSGGAGFRVKGLFEIRGFVSNVFTGTGARDMNGYQKANLTFNRNIGQNTNLNIELDRYDRLLGSDFNLSSFDLSVTAKAKGNIGRMPVWVTLTSGEGQVIEPTSGTLLNHPETGFSVETRLAGIDIGGSFTTDAFQNQSDQNGFNSGDWSQFTRDLKDLTDTLPNEAGLSKFVRLWTGYEFPLGGTVVSFKLNYESAYNGNLIIKGINKTAQDKRAWLKLDFSHNRVRLGATFGFPLSNINGTTRQRLLAQGYLEFPNVFNDGSNIKFWFDRVGLWRYAILNEDYEARDVLGRPIYQGMADYSCLIKIPIGERIEFSSGGSILCNGIKSFNSFLFDLNFYYKINDHVKWITEYTSEKFRNALLINNNDQLISGFRLEF